MVDNVKRDEASPEASAPAERAATARDKDAKLAAKESEQRQKIDAEFREDVQKATEKRDKALSKLKTGRNVAEIAWNETKADEDPAYNALAADHRQKLDTVVQAVRETGNADVIGLEAFEERVSELLAEEKEAEGTPTKVAAAAKAQAEKGK